MTLLFHQDGTNWPGVLMGNLFSRPLATALFLVDGISPGSLLATLHTLALTRVPCPPPTHTHTQNHLLDSFQVLLFQWIK